jgi:hypothetical protein
VNVLIGLVACIFLWCIAEELNEIKHLLKKWIDGGNESKEKEIKGE